MVAGVSPFDQFPIGTLRNHPFVQVPWDKAEDLRSRLAARGIPATACFDLKERTAGLEIYQPIDPDKLREILSAPQG